MKISFKKILPFLVIFLLALPLIFPFLKKGFFITHDGEWAIVRLTAFHFALKDGQIPPRWAGNLFHTYGYPVLNFNYPLPPMTGEMFHLLGFSFVDSVKLVFIFSIIFSAIFFYLLIKELFGKFTAFFGTALYLYYPFRMVNLFVRGSIGESLAFACLPLVYWSLVKLRKNIEESNRTFPSFRPPPRSRRQLARHLGGVLRLFSKVGIPRSKRWVGITTISIALLILSHNSIAFVSLPFVVLFMIFDLITTSLPENPACQSLHLGGVQASPGHHPRCSLGSLFSYSKNVFKQRKKMAILLYCYIAILLLALGLSSFFWLPALFEKQWVILKPEIITKPIEHFPTLAQLIIPSTTPLSFQLGPVHLVLVLLALPFLLKKRDKVSLFFFLVTLVNIFFLLPISTFFWKSLPLMAFVSYPWRLLVPIGFYFSVIGSFVFNQFFPPPALPESVARQFLYLGGVQASPGHRPRWSLGSLAILFTFLILFWLTKDYRRPLAFVNKPDMFYITNQSTTIEGDENTPVWVKTPPRQAPKEKIEVEGGYQIVKQKSNLLEFNLNVEQEQKVFINTIFYPGWQLFVNGVKKQIDYNNDKGIISFEVLPGDYQVKLEFKETSLRLAADLVSLINALLLFKTLFSPPPRWRLARSKGRLYWEN